MNEVNGVKVDVNLELADMARELKKSLTQFKENKTYNKETYLELLSKYADAVTIIDSLKAELDKAQESKMPTSEEIESMAKMFDMLSTMNEKMPELVSLQNSIKKLGA